MELKTLTRGALPFEKGLVSHRKSGCIARFANRDIRGTQFCSDADLGNLEQARDSHNITSAEFVLCLYAAESRGSGLVFTDTQSLGLVVSTLLP